MNGRLVVSFENAIVAEIELDKPVTVIGRHPDCDIVIDHPAISARHALFRFVNRTAYVEDLASTNGVRVNGLATSRQVIHHLDLIELGSHKLHYFDDSLLTAPVSSLEHTVHDGYERTHIGAAPDDAGPAPQIHSPDAPLDRTQLIGASSESEPVAPSPGNARAAPAGGLTLRQVGGPSSGELVTLSGANTLLGVAGGSSALVVRRGRSHFLARLSGSVAPRLNGRTIGPGTHPISAGDTLEVGALRYEVLLENP